MFISILFQIPHISDVFLFRGRSHFNAIFMWPYQLALQGSDEHKVVHKSYFFVQHLSLGCHFVFLNFHAELQSLCPCRTSICLALLINGWLAPVLYRTFCSSNHWQHLSQWISSFLKQVLPWPPGHQSYSVFLPPALFAGLAFSVFFAFSSDFCIFLKNFFYFCLFFFFFFFIQGCTRGIWRLPGQGSNQSYSCQPTPQPQQCQIRAVSEYSSRQYRILNPLSAARDRTRNLMVPRRICFRCAMTGTPSQLLNIEMCQAQTLDLLPSLSAVTCLLISSALLTLRPGWLKLGSAPHTLTYLLLYVTSPVAYLTSNSAVTSVSH